MKKYLSLVLAFALVLSLGVVAFAAGSPVAPSGEGTLDYDYTTRVAPTENENGMELYNADDEIIGTVPAEDVVKVAVGAADTLSEEDREAFLAAYEEAKAVEGKVVKYFYWVDVPDTYKTEDLAWAKFEFKCSGENVEVTVNGNPMEVVHVSGVSYYAKLTEFGAVAILCD